jgi:hypothetical protein
MFYRRIITAVCPRVATHDTPGHESYTFEKSIVIKTIACILRATRHKLAMHAEIGAQQELI